MARTTIGKIPSHHTWQEYLRRTNLLRLKKTDAAFRLAPPTPATPLRWAGADRLLYKDTIIQGIHTGKSLINLNTDEIQALYEQALNSHDQSTLQAHLAKRTGPQPGAPADQ